MLQSLELTNGIIERYITWEWTKWFGLGLFSLSLLILQFVSEDLDIFSKAATSIWAGY